MQRPVCAWQLIAQLMGTRPERPSPGGGRGPDVERVGV